MVGSLEDHHFFRGSMVDHLVNAASLEKPTYVSVCILYPIRASCLLKRGHCTSRAALLLVTPPKALAVVAAVGQSIDW